MAFDYIILARNHIVYRYKVYPGETALAFYTATNETNEPIIGKNHKFCLKFFSQEPTLYFFQVFQHTI